MNPSNLLSLLIVLIFTVSCNQRSSESTDTAVSDSTSYGMSDQSVKLIKTASIRSKVKDIETGVRTLSQIVHQHNGMIFHQTISSNLFEEKEFDLSDDSTLIVSSYSPTASITVRVPAENLQQFLYDVSSIGYLTDKNTLDIQDKSLEYLQNKLKQDNRNSISLKSNTVKNVRLKDEAADQRVANLSIDADALYSPVSIELYQNQIIKKEVVANHRLSSYQLPFSTRFFTAIKNGISLFQSFALVLLNLWAFIILGIVLYAAYRLYKKQSMLINPVK